MFKTLTLCTISRDAQKGEGKGPDGMRVEAPGVRRVPAGSTTPTSRSHSESGEIESRMELVITSFLVHPVGPKLFIEHTR